MKSKYLLPKWTHFAGCVLAILGFVLGYFCVFHKYEIPGFGFRLREKDNFIEKAFENFTNELAIFLVIIGLLCIAFSKSKKEDELNSKIRLNALHWGVITYYVMYIVLFFCNMVVFEIPFIKEYYLELNIFTPLLIFIARFTYLKHFDKDVYLISSPTLLPNRPIKILGLTVCIASLLVLTLGSFQQIEGAYFYGLTYIAFIVGLLFRAFSKYKMEDEMMGQQRLESLQLAVYFNYAVLLLATLLVYSIDFITVLAFANFSLLLFFVIRMEYVNYKNNRILNTFEGGIGS